MAFLIVQSNISPPSRFQGSYPTKKCGFSLFFIGPIPGWRNPAGAAERQGIITRFFSVRMARMLPRRDHAWKIFPAAHREAPGSDGFFRRKMPDRLPACPALPPPRCGRALLRRDRRSHMGARRTAAARYFPAPKTFVSTSPRPASLSFDLGMNFSAALLMQ